MTTMLFPLTTLVLILSASADIFNMPTPPPNTTPVPPTVKPTITHVECLSENPGVLATCAGQQLTAGHITESEFNTLIYKTLDATDKDTYAYVVGLETSPSLQFVVGTIKHHVYSSVYKIPISYPRYGKTPGLITHIKTASRPAVIITDSITKVDQFPADTLRINQYAWGTKEVPQLYASAGSSDCSKIIATPDLKHLPDWPNTQLVLPATTKCFAELHTIFDIYIGEYKLKQIMRAGVLTDVYVPVKEVVYAPPEIKGKASVFQ